jgi:hypothetical protein
MRAILFCILFIILNLSVLSASEKKIISMDKWQLSVNDNTLVTKAPLGNGLITRILSNQFEYFAISKKERAMSIIDARKLMLKMKGDNFEVVKNKNNALFLFKTGPAQFHYVSTVGGYLQLNAKELKKEIDKNRFLKVVKSIRIK